MAHGLRRLGLLPLLLLLLCGASVQADWTATHGRITALPGYVDNNGTVPSQHYSGYVTVGSKQLFYYMAESERDPANDPVVLWLNGGPGCSSMDGFIYEQGPFLFSAADGKTVQLKDNPWRWNRVATMVFLDSPSAVGLSFSLNPRDYATNDTQTARDSAAFLRGFFTRHAHLQANDFYITGESYAGMYIPMLAREVVAGNALGDQPRINIRGLAIGNGVTDDVYDGNAYMQYAAAKSLISQVDYARMMQECRNNFWDAAKDSRCERLIDRAWKQMDDLNIYYILDKCHYEPVTAPGVLSARKQRLAEVRRTHSRTWPLVPVVKHNATVRNWAQILGHNPPCVLSVEADIWLNDPSVRKALHAAGKDMTGPWQLCSTRIRYRSDGGSMMPVHDQLVRKEGLRVLIYSGDADLAVPHTGSEAWTAAMHKLPDAKLCAGVDSSDDAALIAACDGVAIPWQPWYNSEMPRQVAGYNVDYASGLSYATIKGAGHMVPQTHPREAFDMFSRFLGGQSLTLKERPTPAATQPPPASLAEPGADA